MKVILQTDVKGMGKRGDVVNASDGHARNYLFPKKLAVPADKQNLNELSARKSSEAHKRELEKKEAIRIKEVIEKEVKNFWKYYIKRNIGQYREGIQRKGW